MLDYVLKKVSRRMAIYDGSRSIPMRNKRPLFSLSFDDFPVSAAHAGAAVLEEHGARGTFYLTGSTIGQTAWGLEMATDRDIEALVAAGHEIGCHTFSHRPVEDLTSAQIADDVAKNAEVLLRFGVKPQSFAYPFGIFSYSAKLQLSRLFETCRCVRSGFASKTCDPGLLEAVRLYEVNNDLDQVFARIDSTFINGGWLILFTHDVHASPSEIGCRPQLLSAIVKRIKDRGGTILPVATAFQEVRGGN